PRPREGALPAPQQDGDEPRHPRRRHAPPRLPRARRGPLRRLPRAPRAPPPPRRARAARDEGRPRMSARRRADALLMLLRLDEALPLVLESGDPADRARLRRLALDAGRYRAAVAARAAAGAAAPSPER